MKYECLFRTYAELIVVEIFLCVAILLENSKQSRGRKTPEKNYEEIQSHYSHLDARKRTEGI